MSLLVAASGVMWSGAVWAAPSPDAGGGTSGAARVEGPWPPGELLAPGADRTVAPLAAASVTSCPAAPYGVQRSAPGSGKTVALTFDDGPGVTTGALLSVLQRFGVPATFFNLGVNQAARPGWVRNEATLGYALGNHTWDHPSMPSLSASAQASELDRASNQQTALVSSAPCLFRPPYGEYNSTTLSLAQQRRMSVWNWSVDTEDWKAGTSTASSWVDRIISRAEAGGTQQHPVILMHNPPAGIPATVTALPTIITYYRDRGYTFVDLMGSRGTGWARPAASATSAGVHLFVRSASGSLSVRTARGGSWSGWSSMGGQLIGGPAAVATSQTTSTAFGVGTDSHIWQNTVTDSGSVGAWTEIGGTVTSTPGAARAPDGVLSVVVRGTDGAAWLRQNTGGTWGGWTSLGGTMISAPAAAVTADGRLTVAVIGADRAVWVRQRAGTWSSWRRVGGYVDGDATLTVTVGGAGLATVVRGADRGGWSNVADNTATTWRGWAGVSGVLASSPALTVDGSALDAFGYGADGRIWETVAANGTNATNWSGWAVLPS
jgi:peptidoglycan/xylan/chitin deacetylase (PgdA/CDA1 family)